MEPALLDTDILSEVLKRVDRNVVARALEYRQTFGRYTVSAITVLEVVKGFHKVQREERLQQFLEAMSLQEVLPVEMSVATLAGRVYADLERTGQPIGRADPMIAATALRHGLILVSGNHDHYARIQTLGYPLKLDNWRSAPVP
jgi:tRNA(fMet)-specific endonuclease VapC